MANPKPANQKLANLSKRELSAHIQGAHRVSGEKARKGTEREQFWLTKKTDKNENSKTQNQILLFWRNYLKKSSVFGFGKEISNPNPDYALAMDGW